VWVTMQKIFLDFRRDQLKNGLMILTLEDHSHPIVTYQVHFATGSRNERPGITGISHLFEHMMFRGSKELGPEEFARIIQANGGTLNAFTTVDNTSYFENLPPAILELAIRLEAERLENLRLNQDNLDTEREVVRSERKLRTVNAPFGLLVEQLFAVAFDQHPYQWPVIGWDHDLKRLTLEDCREYYRNGYAPNNAVITIVGDFARDKALAWVERYYGHLTPQPPRDALPAREQPQRGERRACYKKVSQVEAFFAGFHCPGGTDPDVFPLLAVSHILSHGKSSRLYQRFVKTGKAVEAQVEVDPPPLWPMDPGLLQVYAIAVPGVPIGHLEKEIWQAIEEIQTAGIEAAELAKAKRGLIAAFVMGLQSVFMQGLSGGLAEIKARDFSVVNSMVERIEKITREDIQRAAQRYLVADNRTVITLQPITPEENERLAPVE
jgi:zinc protease